MSRYITFLPSSFAKELVGLLHLISGRVGRYWSVVEDAIIQLHWLRFYEMTGAKTLITALDVYGKPIALFDSRDYQRFATIDIRGSQRSTALRCGPTPFRVEWVRCG